MGDITYKQKTIPLLDIGFEYPGDDAKGEPTWSVHNYPTTTSDYSRYKISDGDYISLSEDRHPETYAIFIYSKEYPDLTTVDTAKEEWSRQQRQPDHDNVFEYSNLGFIRELNIIRTDDYEYLGKPAIFTEYTFSNWSKFWIETAIMFPHGKRVYTIKYRRERDEEDRFYEVFQHVLDTFHFLTPEPRYSSFKDLSANHPNSTAIERLKGLGIVGGYADGSFKPDATINRAEFVKILTSEPLVNATELATCNTSALQFSDVSSGVWYEPHLCVAVERGMISGYPDGTFGGAKSILFTEAAKIVSTFFAEQELQSSSGEWYLPFVNFLANKRAIPVNVNSLSMPLTRGMMSEILYRIYDNVTTKDSRSLTDFSQ